LRVDLANAKPQTHRAWIVLQKLLPLIEQHLASGTWPKPVPAMGDVHPAFTTPPREITFQCKAS